ncbi:MAG: very short patch repair endonuclease [Chitinophagaceae bacterium]
MTIKIDWAKEDVEPYRRKTMSKIRAKNTKPELRFRKALWHVGIRYRLHGKKLPGSPDIYIRKYKLAIFIDGEFWHGYEWEKHKNRIHTRKEFWTSKIETNIQRDQNANLQLRQMGYEVMRFWSHEIDKNQGACVHRILDYINAYNNRWENGSEDWKIES